MHRLLKSLIVVASLLFAPMALANETVEPSPEAMAFAGTFSDKHLSGMLSRIGARQPAIVAAAQLHGGVVAAVFDAEIDKAVARHGARWHRNLALAWMPLLTAEEFESLMAGPSDSPYRDKYLEARGPAGRAMGELSGELFREILGEVINNTMAELAEPAEGTAKE